MILVIRCYEEQRLSQDDKLTGSRRMHKK